MVLSKLKGHPIEYVNDQWIFSDTKLPTVETHHLRGCGRCSRMETEEGYDACIGKLQGVLNACCGHGVDNEKYIMFDDENRTIVRGNRCDKFFLELKED